MRSVQMLENMKAGVLLLATLMLAGLTVVMAGCDDSSDADMYAQISGGGSPAATSTPSGSTATRPSSSPALIDPGAADEVVPEEAEDPTLVTSVVIEKLLVKAPYPEFTGEDRYDVKVTLMTTEPVEAQVFRIVAIGADGQVVGEQDRHLKLPQKKARTLNFDEIYCLSIPVAIEFHTTDLEATAANGDGSNVSERGSSRGGGGATSGGVGLN